MTRKLKVLDLPLYKDYLPVFLEIIEILDEKLETSDKHKILIEEAYNTAISILPNLNAGFNYWGLKEKKILYNKVRSQISRLQGLMYVLDNFEIVDRDYFDELENSIKYVGGLLKKLEISKSENE